MGMDAWVYSGEKPDINRLPLKPHTDDLDKLDYNYFVKEHINDMSKIQDLLPICIEKEGTTVVIDWDKLKKDNNIPLNTRSGGYTQDKYGITQYFYDDNNKYEVTLSNLKFNSYKIEKDVHLYITRLNEITYFRNEWDLDIEIGTIYNKFSYINKVYISYQNKLFSRVDFPEPLGQSIVKISPSTRLKFIFFSTSSSPSFV